MTAQRLTFAEATGTLGDVQQGPAAGRRFKALLIRAGWGSAGYYGPDVLAKDGPTAWPAGTQNYLDHPSLSESVDRPERSVKDLASRLVTDPVWDDAADGLVAEVEVFPQWGDLLNEDFASNIGLSIRAYGTAEQGEAEGRTGPIITSIDEGISVDWVTKAGAGGRVLELIESARATIREAAVSDKPWSDFTQADYDIGQWRRACLIGPDSQSDAKGDYKVSVKEPDGTLNRNAVHAAAGAHGISAVTGISADARKAAAKKLVGLYRNQLKEEPPAGLLSTAGMQQESRRPLAEKANVGCFMEAQIHSHFTQMADSMYGDGRLTRPERIGLSNAIGDGLQAFTTRVTADHPQLYERGRWQEPDAADGQITESRRRRLREADSMTANELSQALSDAVRETYGGEGIFTWVRDSTDQWVVFSVEDDTDCDLYQQTYTADPAAQEVTLTGEPAEVIAKTTYVPAPKDPDDDPAGSGTGEITENAPGSLPDPAKKKEGVMPELTEAEARALTEARDKAVTELAEAQAALQAEREKAAASEQKLTEAADVTARVATLEEKLTASEAKNLALENDRLARVKVDEALKNSGLPDISHPRVTAAVCRDLPITDTGVLDVAKLTEAVTAAVDGEKTYLAAFAESRGAGTVTGLGGGPEPQELDEAAVDAALEKSFNAMGLSESHAKAAASGR
jgi:hypothetical protein